MAFAWRESLVWLGLVALAPGCAVLDAMSGNSQELPGDPTSNTCEGVPTCFSQLPSVALPGAVVAMAAGHVLGDTLDDIVMVTENPHQVLVATEDGPGRFAVRHMDTLRNRPRAVVLGDLDQSGIPESAGRLDIAIILEGQPSVCLFHSHPYLHQTEEPGCAGRWQLPDQPVAIAVGEFDGDQQQELVVATERQVNVYRVRGDFETLEIVTSFSTPSGAQFVGVGNLNGSGGKNDIAILTTDGSMHVFFDLPPPMMSPTQLLGPGNRPLLLAIANFDGDTIDDIAILTDCGQCTNPVRLYMNSGNEGPGRFIEQRTVGTMGVPRYLVTGRFRDGGSLGLALSNSAGKGSGSPADVEIWLGMDSGVPNDFFLGLGAGGPAGPLVAGRFAEGSVDDLAVVVRLNQDSLSVWPSNH